jgi:Fe-S-cluster-containing dehydrogenase component
MAGKVSRREFLKKTGRGALSGLPLLLIPLGGRHGAVHGQTDEEYDWDEHYYVYLVDIEKCIGCGMCARACKRENDVPDGFFRTWVERYIVSGIETVKIDSPEGSLNGFGHELEVGQEYKGFFVPKLCNQCTKTPCVQVCPVGASYYTRDGVVMVDDKRCIGCGYCVQACPYGSRFINPGSHTADKCTLCYHRITKGLKPACVAACPTGTRQLGDLKRENDPIRHIIATRPVRVLQPELLTKPKCYYLGLDQEVR